MGSREPEQLSADSRGAEQTPVGSRELAESAEISLTATVTADQLRFDDQPAAAVEFTGDPGNESTSRDTRENLPDEVAEGVTYRRVRVDYVLAAAMNPDLATDAQQQPGADEA
ncbi:MAG: hypothetical protein ACRDT1_17655, partial [Micromonosporaceae bacterium]